MKKYVAARSTVGKRGVYHTDKDCWTIRKKDTRTASENEIEHYDMRLCKWCADEANRNTDGYCDYAHRLASGDFDL